MLSTWFQIFVDSDARSAYKHFSQVSITPTRSIAFYLYKRQITTGVVSGHFPHGAGLEPHSSLMKTPHEQAQGKTENYAVHARSLLMLRHANCLHVRDHQDSRCRRRKRPKDKTAHQVLCDFRFLSAYDAMRVKKKKVN